VVGTGYYCLDLSANFYAGLSFTCVGVVSCLVEAQFVIFRKPQALLYVKLLALTLLFIATQLCATSLFYLVFRALSEEVAYALGNFCPSVLFVVAFFPQIWEFVSIRDVQGYSFGVTILDIAGCALNCVYLYAQKDLLDATKEAIPFLAIGFMHLVLIGTALVILGSRKQSNLAESNKSCAEGDLNTGKSDTQDDILV